MRRIDPGDRRISYRDTAGAKHPPGPGVSVGGYSRRGSAPLS
ncbi:MAG: hypothetical protein ABSG43_09875 [Solirubrobacteraceae bacterium]